MKWFDEYRYFLSDEKEYYKEYIYNDEQKEIALNYDRLLDSLKFIAENPKTLFNQYSKQLNLAEEVALSFEDECLSISQILYEKNYIDTESIQLIMQIRVLFDEIRKDFNNDWTLNYMVKEKKWNEIRNLARKVLFRLDENVKKECLE